MIAENIVYALRATWKAQKAKLKKKFPDLTKSDLDFKESETK
ncbi:MAG: hypothetical protein U5K54_02705 [Cytophagales bacterium]|nr:hypothetical protein [Cytophagales bacterium]